MLLLAGFYFSVSYAISEIEKLEVFTQEASTKQVYDRHRIKGSKQCSDHIVVETERTY